MEEKMKYVNYPFSTVKRLSFYLATEEFLALHYPVGEYFFMWQVHPSVIFGRNQLIENEVNLEYVRSQGIQMYRRKSGGGCVYADFSNIMFSFITPDFNKDFVFDKYLGKIVDVLKGLGLNACFSGRNDILIDGLKVSGNAFYKVVDKAIVHGTMLFATDLSIMVKAITPSNEKLISKGVDSVRKRVTNLSEHLAIDIETFKKTMRTKVCDEALTLSDADIEGIEEIEKTYLAEDFIYGKNPRFTLLRKGYVTAGYLEIGLEIKNNIVKKMNILGDFFVVSELDTLLNKLIGIAFTKEAFTAALSGLELSDFILKLQLSDFLQIIF
jgi:lipoyltransferase/lipoate-protein ligase